TARRDYTMSSFETDMTAQRDYMVSRFEINMTVQRDYMVSRFEINMTVQRDYTKSSVDTDMNRTQLKSDIHTDISVSPISFQLDRNMCSTVLCLPVVLLWFNHL
ncbi:hypothetical protein AB4423_13710, partial [Vibrio chagasii]|uniref:hypothetical protein n=1 Tax=Vibrio chagasii TaxID=170679 RepID=UPI0035546F60